MKFTIDTADLTAALARLKGVVARKTTLPVLGGVLMEVNEAGELMLSGTDLDMTLVLRVEAEIERGGACVVNCARLSAAVAKIEGEALAIELRERKLVVEGDEQRFTMLTLPSAEFPPCAVLPGSAVSLQPKEGAWAKAIETVLPFVSDDDTRLVLNGVHVTAEGAEVQCVATDGRRLAVTNVAMDVPAGTVAAILPTAAAKLSICGDGGGATSVRISTDAMEFAAKTWRLVTRQIEGNFPNWRQVVPPSADSLRKITVDRKEMIAAVTFAQTFCSEQSSSVKFSAEKGKLTVSANTPDVGESAAKLSAKVDGPPIDVAYQPAFVLDVLHAIGAEAVTFGMRDEMSPCRVEEPGTVAVLMPMRIQ